MAPLLLFISIIYCFCVWADKHVSWRLQLSVLPDHRVLLLNCSCFSRSRLKQIYSQILDLFGASTDPQTA